jgi:RraA family protein
MSNVGFRVFTKIKRADQDLIEQFRNIPSSNIADVMWRSASLGGTMRAYHAPGLTMAGSAITVRVSPADNLLMHKAMEVAMPGDVIIVETGGDLTNAITGEIMCTYAKKKGIAGFVIDGAVRDSKGIEDLRFPVYAKGLQPRGPYKDGPGEINVPISCNGVVVNPGDLVIGDDDGVVIVPLKEAEGILAKALEKVAQEQVTLQQIADGTYDTSWIDVLLEQKGCKVNE